MRRARLARDPSYDGVFWVGVRTTGIYCRPSCPARPPLEENVTYLYSPAAARAADLRACKRCRPDDAAQGRPSSLVQRLLRLSDEHRGFRLTDADLTNHGIDPVRARRAFRRERGTTFHAFHRARRMGRAADALGEGSSVLEVAADQGYSSPSGLQQAFEQSFGVAPRAGLEVRPLVTRSLESPIGRLELAATPRGICLLEFHDRRSLPTTRRKLEARHNGPLVPGDSPHLDAAERQLGEYFAGERRAFDLELDLMGTPFQRRVWRALTEIPYGETESYGGLAARIDKPGGSRAVGRANGANVVAIVLPCHRVVQADGKLRGYGGGLWRKQWLLEHEGR